MPFEGRVSKDLFFLGLKELSLKQKPFKKGGIITPSLANVNILLSKGKWRGTLTKKTLNPRTLKGCHYSHVAPKGDTSSSHS